MTESAAPSRSSDPDPSSLELDEALGRVLERIGAVSETEPVDTAASRGRVLAKPVHAATDQPAYDNSAMDGYALRLQDFASVDTRNLELIGISSAGSPFTGTVDAGQCVRIMTGGIIPEGADAIVIQENTGSTGEPDTVRILKPPRAGEWLRRAGSHMKAGELVLDAGKRIDAADVGFIASMGLERIEVFRRPRVAVLSTGDEVRQLGEPLNPGDVYDSNRHTLRELVLEDGCEHVDLGVCPDDPVLLREAYLRGAAAADLLIVAAGASVGDADFTKQVLDELGHAEFWKIAMKPGRPLSFGRVGDSHFFGLPGNPVSVMVTYLQLVRPALWRLAGARGYGRLRLRARTLERLAKSPGRLEFQRGILETGDDGATVRATGAQGSDVLRSMSRANCLIVLPLASGDIEAGEWVTVEPLTLVL